MSTVKSNKIQLGTDTTASNNFTIYQPNVPDGSLRFGVGNADNPTEVMKIDNNGLDAATLTGLKTVNGSSIVGSGDIQVGGGKVLQVQSFTKTNTYTGSGNFKDPALDVLITPTSTSSKILVNVSVCFSTNATTIGFVLRRNGAAICRADASGTRSRMTVITECGNNVWQTNANNMFLDSPNTTSQVTYDIIIGSHDGREFRVNRSGSTANNSLLDSSYATSTITAIEIGA